MTLVPQPGGSESLFEHIRLRYGLTILLANLSGAVAVFLLLVFVLPGPTGSNQGALKLGAVIAFVIGAAIGFPRPACVNVSTCAICSGARSARRSSAMRSSAASS
jgi:hypothetical protein